MSQNRLGLEPRSNWSDADEQELEDDIVKIVRYLDSQRSDAERHGASLLGDIGKNRHAMDREQLFSRLASRQVQKVGDQLAEMSRYIGQVPKPKPPLSGDGTINERFHSFCHEIDQLGETFRQRVVVSKPLEH